MLLKAPEELLFLETQSPAWPVCLGGGRGGYWDWGRGDRADVPLFRHSLTHQIFVECFLGSGSMAEWRKVCSQLELVCPQLSLLLKCDRDKGLLAAGLWPSCAAGVRMS